MKSKRKYPLKNEGAVFPVSFFSFSFVALYDEINTMSFLFSAAVALYDRIFKVLPLHPQLYVVFQKSQQGKGGKVKISLCHAPFIPFPASTTGSGFLSS